MIKIIVTSFYNTLINSEEAISVSTMLELDRIRKEGILFCITTSKSLKIVKEYEKYISKHTMADCDYSVHAEISDGK